MSAAHYRIQPYLVRKYSEMVWRGRWWLWTALAAVGCDTLVCGG